MTNPILQAIFQSTLPTRGSDLRACMMKIAKHYFNPRSPRGGATSALYFSLCAERCISIHAPHEGERPLAEIFGIYM